MGIGSKIRFWPREGNIQDNDKFKGRFAEHSYLNGNGYEDPFFSSSEYYADYFKNDDYMWGDSDNGPDQASMDEVRKN